MNDRRILEQLKNLAEGYGLRYVDCYEARAHKDKVDFFFVDESVYRGLKNCIEEYFVSTGTELCVLQNPMRESPVPSLFLFFFVSTCWKEPNNFSKSPGLIPCPESSIEIFRFTISASVISSNFNASLTNPASVNLIALLARLIITCRV